MRLRVSNVGRIGQADIAIDGITVVAGENNTGKSTVGKALWCMFNSYHNLHSRIAEERVARIARVITRRIGLRPRVSNAMQRLGIEDLLVAFVNEGDSSPDAARALVGEIAGLVNDRYGDASLAESECDAVVDEVVYAMTADDGEILAFFLDRLFSSEFYGQPRNLYRGEPGRVDLAIRSEEAHVTLYDYGIEVGGSTFDLHTEAVYFDDCVLRVWTCMIPRHTSAPFRESAVQHR